MNKRQVINRSLFSLFVIGLGVYCVVHRNIRHSDLVHDVAFSLNGKYVASAGDDGSVLIWEADTGTAHAQPGKCSNVFAVSFSPDGGTLACATWDGTRGVIEFRDTSTGTVKAKIGNHDHQYRALRYSPDGVMLASGGDWVTVWDVATGKPRFKFKSQTGTVMSVAFSHSGDILASASLDGTVRLWDVHCGEERGTFIGHNGSAYCIAFSSDDRHLAVASNNLILEVDPEHMVPVTPCGEVVIWDILSGLEKTRFRGTSRVWSVAFSPDNESLVSGEDDGTVRAWNMKINRSQAAIKLRTGGIRALTFSPDGRILAAGCADGTVRMIDGAREIK